MAGVGSFGHVGSAEQSLGFSLHAAWLRPHAPINPAPAAPTHLAASSAPSALAPRYRHSWCASSQNCSNASPDSAQCVCRQGKGMGREWGRAG